MCLEVDRTIHKNNKPIILTEDLVCYKVVKKFFEDKWATPYELFPVQFNTLLKTRFNYFYQCIQDKYTIIEINRGFHSIVHLEDCKKLYTHLGGTKSIIKVIYPKDTRVWYGTFSVFGESVVGNKIIMTDEFVN